MALIFPPFVVYLPNGAAISKGYGHLFNPPRYGYLLATVNVPTLLAEWLGLTILGSVVWVLLKGASVMSNQSTSSNNAFGGAATQKSGVGSPKILGAGFWSRVAAYLVDYVILFVGLFVVFLLLGLLGVVTRQRAEDSGTGLGMLAFWLYFALQESGPRQATFGKRALSIKVVTLQGVAPSFWRATGRHFAKLFSGLILGIGFLMCLFNAKKQCLHDIMANCLVVRDDATEHEIVTALGQIAS